MKYPEYPEYNCPVCNFKGLYEPAYSLTTGSGSDDICPCCGFQFGLDNFDYPTKEEAHTAWRKKWIETGHTWFSKAIVKPENWNPIKQLEGLEEIDK